MKGITGKSTSEYSIVYSGMRGVDFSSENSRGSRQRYAYLENMYKDYDGDGEDIIESIPGFRKILSLGKRINGIFHQRSRDGEYAVIHAGEFIYRLSLDDIDDPDIPMVLGEVNDKRSCALQAGEDVIILDGVKMRLVTAEGELLTVGDDQTVAGYVPTTYLNGIRYEQRNLLTSAFRHKFFIDSPDSYSFGTPELNYEIIDEEAAECRVIGLSEDTVESVYIPSFTTIAGKAYRITEIASYGFADVTTMKYLYAAEGLRYVGKLAFKGCTSLLEAYLPNTVTHIDNSAFSGCVSMTLLHVGIGVERFGNSMLAQCVNLESFCYAGSEDDFALIENTGVIYAPTVKYNCRYDFGRIRLPILSPASGISDVTVTGEPEPSVFKTVYKGDTVDYVIIEYNDKAKLYGREITVTGMLSEKREDNLDVGGFLASEFIKEDDRAVDIISKCTVMESFDGKIFIGGNPSYPNAVFYTASDTTGKNNPLFFGDMNYFSDGVGGFNTIALLSTSDGLAVFKEGDDGGGSIYYHVSRETGIDLIPKIYPVSYIHSGVVAYPGTVSFFDDPIFLSAHGVTALDKRQINLDRSIAIRSHNVNARLLCEDLENACLAVWRGYLAVAVGGRMYLADSRATFTHPTGFKEYEWFYLDGIGTYTGEVPVYRFSDEVHPKYATVEEERQNTTVTTPVYVSGYNYFTREGDTLYKVYPSGEYTGGTFHPLSAMISIGRLLIFGTECGDICVFNNDKRGVPPEHIKGEPDFDADEYKERYGRRIHHSHYSFAGHAPTYALKTPYDNGDIPHMQKRSVKKSLTVKCRSDSASSVICEVGTDSSSYKELCCFPGTPISFSDMNFEKASLSPAESFTVPISEKEKGWVEKQITLYSKDYNAPIGIYNIAYRFRVTGRVKTKKYKQ